MTIAVKVLKDSLSPTESKWKRLTTLQLRYPHFIHSQVMTHRMFSRNSSSSRAIPVSRLIADILEDPAIPLFWGRAQKGMQAVEENSVIHDGRKCWSTIFLHRPKVDEFPGGNGVQTTYWREKLFESPESAWLEARDRAVEAARAFAAAGYSKEITNRLLEPFSHINVVLTSVEWDNFFWQRTHESGAQAEIVKLAKQIKQALDDSEPTLLEHGRWHLPYISDDEAADLSESDRIKASVARCARVSYMTHEGKVPTIEEDRALYDRLVNSNPPHLSPTEHQARPDWMYGVSDRRWAMPKLHGNLAGWRQYRKELEKLLGKERAGS